MKITDCWTAVIIGIYSNSSPAQTKKQRKHLQINTHTHTHTHAHWHTLIHICNRLYTQKAYFPDQLHIKIRKWNFYNKSVYEV